MQEKTGYRIKAERGSRRQEMVIGVEFKVLKIVVTRDKGKGR